MDWALAKPDVNLLDYSFPEQSKTMSKLELRFAESKEVTPTGDLTYARVTQGVLYLRIGSLEDQQLCQLRVLLLAAHQVERGLSEFVLRIDVCSAI